MLRPVTEYDPLQKEYFSIIKVATGESRASFSDVLLVKHGSRTHALNLKDLLVFKTKVSPS